MRQCGDCQLCCKLLPVRSLDKGAHEKCKHQRHHKGCAVYAKLGRIAPECRIWSCAWLLSQDTADLSRPDRAHYVVDIMPDYVTCEDDGVVREVPVIQIWCDPDYPDAHRDPALRRFLDRQLEKRTIMGLVRYDSREAMALVPKPGGGWFEKRTGLLRETPHSVREIVDVVGPMQVDVEMEEGDVLCLTTSSSIETRKS